MPQSNKTEQSIYGMFAGFQGFLTTFSAPPQILAASTVAQFVKRRNDGDGFFFGATAAGLF